MTTFFILGETLNFTKIYSPNLNLENASCTLELWNVVTGGADKLVKTFEAKKNEKYFSCIVQTEGLDLTTEIYIILSINQGGIISKKKVFFKQR
jgi:uncharacterized membrane protein